MPKKNTKEKAQNFEKLGFFKRIKKIVLEPSRFFEKEFTEELTTPLIHVFLIGLISSIGRFILWLPFTLVATILAGPLGLLKILADVAVGPFFAVIAWILVGLVNHLFVKLLGGKKGWKRTLKVFAYASTANLITIIPHPTFVLLSIAYSLFLVFLGYKSQQKLGTTNALIAVLLPATITTVILIILLFMIVAGVLVFGASMLQEIGGLESLIEVFKALKAV